MFNLLYWINKYILSSILGTRWNWELRPGAGIKKYIYLATSYNR